VHAMLFLITFEMAAQFWGARSTVHFARNIFKTQNAVEERSGFTSCD